jgi:hypothetical protein
VEVFISLRARAKTDGSSLPRPLSAGPLSEF